MTDNSLVVGAPDYSADLPPADTYQAVCFQVWDVGLQKFVQPDGSVTVTHQIMIGWELDARVPGGTRMGDRFQVLKPYSRSLGPKSNLCKDLTAWRGKPFTPEEKKGFNLATLVGANCFLSLIHEVKNDKTKVKIASISKLPANLGPIVSEWDKQLPSLVKFVLERGVPALTTQPTPQEAPKKEEEVPF